MQRYSCPTWPNRFGPRGVSPKADHSLDDLEFAGLAHGNAVTTSLIRERLEDDHDLYGEDNDPDLPASEVTRYRSCPMTIAYVAQDRTALQRTFRELAKG